MSDPTDGPVTFTKPVIKTTGTPLLDGGQGGTLLVPWEDLMYAGSGFDTVSRKNFSSPLTKRGTELILKSFGATGDTGQYVQTKILQVESAERIREVLQLGTKADFGYDAFSASTVGRFLKETQIDRYNLYFLVICYVQNTVKLIEDQDLILKPDVKAMSPEEFRANYGDTIVSGWIKGGYLIGLAKVTAESKQSLMKAQTELKGGYKDGAIDFSSTFAAAFDNLHSIQGVTSSLEVIYAGMNNAKLEYQPVSPFTTNPVSRGGLATSDFVSRGLDDGLGAGAGAGAGGATEEISPKNIKVVDEDDDEDSPEGEFLSEAEANAIIQDRKNSPIDLRPRPLDTKKTDSTGKPPDNPGKPPVNTGKPPVNDGGTSGTPSGTTPAGDFKHIEPGLERQTFNTTPVRMNMQGLINAAGILPTEVIKNGVPLQAVLKPYSAIGYKTKLADVTMLEISRKREKLSDCYMRANYIWKSADYALNHRGEVGQSRVDLEKLKSNMTTLMQKCSDTWRSLDSDYKTPVSDDDFKLPDPKDLPNWANEKTRFSLFGAKNDPTPPAINPKLFVNTFSETVDKVVNPADTSLTPAARTLLKGYLNSVRLRSIKNFKNAGDLLLKLSSAFRGSIDSKPDLRSKRLAQLAATAFAHLNALSTDRQELPQEFGLLEGKEGLDGVKLTALLKNVNEVVSGQDDIKYGFSTFWKAVHKNLDGLAQDSKTWSEQDKFNDLLDYSRDKSYAELGDVFDEQAAILENGEAFRKLQ